MFPIGSSKRSQHLTKQYVSKDVQKKYNRRNSRPLNKEKHREVFSRIREKT